MGTENISKEVAGVANANAVNQHRNALIGDLVSRNLQGVPESLFGALGTSSLVWLAAYVKSVFLGSNSQFVTLEESGSLIAVKNGSTVVQYLGAKPQTTDGSDPGVNGISVTASSTQNVSVDSTWESKYSLTLTTVGRPVEICLIPGDNPSASAETDFSYIEITPVSGTPPLVSRLSYRILRGSDVVQTPVRLGAQNFNSVDSWKLGPGSIYLLDVEAVAGTHTYTLQLNGKSGDGIKNCRLMAREL